MKKSILIVDDDFEFTNLIADFLTDMGWKCHKTYSADEAKKFLENSIPDMIILDIMLPDKDGISFCNDIKNDKKLSHIPILIMSNLSDNVTINDAILFGAKDFLAKPFDLMLLKEKVSKFIG